MHAFLDLPKEKRFVCALSSGILILGLMFSERLTRGITAEALGVRAGGRRSWWWRSGSWRGRRWSCDRSRRRRGGNWRRRERWGRRNSSSPEWSNGTYDLPSGYGFEHQGSKVRGQAQRGAAWSPS